MALFSLAVTQFAHFVPYVKIQRLLGKINIDFLKEISGKNSKKVRDNFEHNLNKWNF
jgi:hypothetical protein